MVKNKENANVSAYVEANGIEQVVQAGIVEARSKAILETDKNAMRMLAMAMFGGGSASSLAFPGALRGMPSARPPSGNPLYPNGDMKYFVDPKVMSLLSIVHLEDLVGTPWEPSSARNHHELADDRWDDLQAAFEAAITKPGTVGVIY